MLLPSFPLFCQLAEIPRFLLIPFFDESKEKPAFGKRMNELKGNTDLCSLVWVRGVQMRLLSNTFCRAGYQARETTMPAVGNP